MMVQLSNLAAATFLTFVITSHALNQSFHNNKFASKDYGGMIHKKPAKVIYPASASDISFVVSHHYRKAIVRGNPVKVAARGNGHSINGQAQTLGVVVNMQSLPAHEMSFNTTAEPAYVDVPGGELWINVLKESLRHDLTPVSWVDYLYLTVGGTLSNAGISGQTFRHGPQIDNVLQLEIITGKGEVKTVSKQRGDDLFYGALGGLGQFGIITKARIVLAPAPRRVKWIRALYTEFATMSEDQEYLISATDTFDYVEGFVIINDTDPSRQVADWGSSYLTKDPLQTSLLNSNGKTQYGLEVAKYYSPNETGSINQKITKLLSRLNYSKLSLNISDVTYIEFLDRVHTTELELRKKGLWEIPHPWINLLVPKQSIHKFVGEVFGNIITEPVNGPILIYPFNVSRWEHKTSMVTPKADIIYQVAILSAAVPTKTRELERLLTQNKKVLDFCQQAKLGVKEYLPHYTTYKEWKAHFGKEWIDFVKKKKVYDPLTLLAPGQLIFPNATALEIMASKEVKY